ncbi:putative ABC transport system ATP-binding protein [Methanofollis sp. W23]|uniref:ABC transporter ATP-binding protein n=1 Tax=Methanofollis sp. W23 TaxID=2817849 RepID=UPI001AE84F0C|nr:ABC transporter ATP-binding protein [Methanofollis sp. W23]MBP2144740.1 putative ABC transport system ATP-binding protein [Methanofollis sp. W23]
MTAAIEVTGLGKRYPPAVEALRDVDLRVESGEFVALLGKSGSGKSTLLNILGGLDHPERGSVRIAGAGVDYTDRTALVALRRQTIGFVFQDFSLIPTMTALENVAYPLLFNYQDRKMREARAAALLERVGLAHRRGHYPHQMSGGEQQRVAVARALVGRPSIILADEPTGNLDTVTSAEIIGLLREINREDGTTLLVVTHDPDVGAEADRVVVMQDGQVVA